MCLPSRLRTTAGVIAIDERFGAYTDRLILPGDKVDVSGFAHCAFPVHEENVRLVMALASRLDIGQETVCRGIQNVRPDIGMYKEIHLQHICVRNAFAVNDPDSFFTVLNDYARHGAYSLIYNHRKDRSYRLEAFARVLRASACPPECIGVVGEDKEWCAKYMRRVTGLPAEPVENPSVWVRERDVANAARTDSLRWKHQGRRTFAVGRTDKGSAKECMTWPFPSACCSASGFMKHLACLLAVWFRPGISAFF